MSGHEQLSWELFGSAARQLAGDVVAEVRCAVIYQKPQSAVDCEYVWRRTDRWIEFPWSS